MKNEAEQKLLDAVEQSIGALVEHALTRLPSNTQALISKWLNSGICKLVTVIELDPFSLGLAMVRKDGKGVPVGLVQIVDNREDKTKVEVGH